MTGRKYAFQQAESNCIVKKRMLINIRFLLSKCDMPWQHKGINEKVYRY